MTVTLAAADRRHQSTVHHDFRLIKMASEERISAESPWLAIGTWLILAAQNKTWSESERSYTAWVSAQARRLGLSEASLWRYATATRSLDAIRFDIIKAGHRCPDLVELQDVVSPESVELATKIRRYSSPEDGVTIFRRLIVGEVSRAELRKIWAGCRATHSMAKTRRAEDLQGSDAAFDGSQRIPARPQPIPDGLLAGLLREAYCDSHWPTICCEVKAPRAQPSPERFADHVVVLQERPDSPLQLHGFVELKAGQEREVLAHLSAAAERFDAVWLIQREWPAEGIWAEVARTEEVGILRLTSAGLSAQILRMPTQSNVVSINKKLDTTQLLLASALAGCVERNGPR